VSSIPTGARLFAAALLVYAVCPPFLSYDSYYTVPTALSLLRHGTTAVDEYVPGAPPEASYAVERVGDHWQNYYPHAVSVLALPVIVAIQAATSTVAAVFPRAATLAPHPAIAAFLSGDLVGGRPITELLCGAFFGALAVWLQYRIARLLADGRTAVWYALLFAFGTAEWSTASRNLMQHGLSVALLSAAIYIVVDGRRIAYASIPLALAFTVRPSNAIAAAVFTVFIVVHYREHLMRFIGWAFPIAAVFFLHNWITLHRLLPRYFVTAPMPYPALPGLAMHLLSPSRGLFIYAPIFLFSIVGIYLAIRRRWLYPLPAYLAAILVLHTILIASCWPGHCFGARYFVDLTPILMLFLLPMLEFWRKSSRQRSIAAVFVVCAGWSVFVNLRGATSIAVNQWSILPVNVDDAQWRVWDWRDPQFLRGLK
jgi:hypothetical protein